MLDKELKRWLSGSQGVLLLQRILIQFQGPTFGSSQLSAPGNPTSSSGLHGHLHQHIYIPIHRYAHLYISKNKS